MNRRIRKTISNGGLTGDIPDGATDYIWHGWQVVEERNSSNAPIRQYIWGTYIDECIQLTTLAVLGPQSVPAGAYYLLQDLLYRAVALTNSSGGVVEAYDTDAYGNTLIFTGPGTDGVWFTDDDTQSSYGANEIIYCGYRYDPETELYYVRNRTYSPILGRWLQRDPIGYAGGINLYEYVGGRAEVAVDPAGEKYWTAYGPYGPVWDPWDQACYVYFVLYASPSWYNYIWPWDYGRTSVVSWQPLPGISQKECSPNGFRCAGPYLAAQIKLDLAHAKFSVAGHVSFYNLKLFEFEEWGWGTAAGAGGEGAGGAAASGAGGVHGVGAAGEPECPKAPPKPGCP